MSRFCGEKDTGPILDAAQTWRNQCLLERGGALGSDAVWRDEYVAELVQYYVQNLDWGEGNFLGKLSHQISPASPEAKILAAEIMWVMMLCPSNISPDKKVENIQTIYEWSGKKLDLNQPLLQSGPLLGVGSAGTAYNNLRWRELKYFVVFLQAFFNESEQKRSDLIADGLYFSSWLEQIPENDQRQLRHMLLFLLFPDQFERIFGKSDRVKCALAFSDLSKATIKNMSARELDEKLAAARSRLESEYKTEKLDWYVPPLRAFWQKTSKAGEQVSGSFYDVLERFLDQSNSGELTTRSYPSKYEDLEIRVSFGQGNQAQVTWAAFLAPGQTPTNGIFPVYLHYKAKNLLILSKGISATNTPKLSWPGQGLQTISSYFAEHFGEAAVRYGDSYIYRAYDLSEDLDPILVDEALSELIAEYKIVTSMTGKGDLVVAEPPAISEDSANYSLEDATDGLFLEDHKVQTILQLLRSKKNIILQGPPGVGKTFVCRRIAFALMGAKDSTRLRMIQFHQSYSYEDFVQGYRPTGSGFTLKNGIFHQFCTRAQNDPERDYVFIIDEINRGNLSKIFGELMMLIEYDKRGEEFAIPLAYSDTESDTFYIPDNLHLIGLMNTADRSLAMVDYALRRRFAFVDLAPAFSNQKFKDYLAKAGAPDDLVRRITSRMGALNSQISAEKSDLGPGFCIGHSFFCVGPNDGEYDTAWYETIIRSEIAPLISEYWFDDPSKVESAISQLLAP